MARGIQNIKVRFVLIDDDTTIACVDHNQYRTECLLNEAHPFIVENRDLSLLQTKMLVAQMVITHWLDCPMVLPKKPNPDQMTIPEGPRFPDAQKLMAKVLRYLCDQEKEASGGRS
jgi:hypothetical protein